MDGQKPLGYCELHDKEILLWEFECKGCWSCHHFAETDDFPFVDVVEASEILGVSQSTIRRWIRKGKLNAHLFKRIRPNFSSPPKKYFIEKESVNQLLKHAKKKPLLE